MCVYAMLRQGMSRYADGQLCCCGTSPTCVFRKSVLLVLRQDMSCYADGQL